MAEHEQEDIPERKVLPYLMLLCFVLFVGTLLTIPFKLKGKPLPKEPPVRETAQRAHKVRAPVVAGSFYPGAAEELGRVIDGYLDAAAKKKTFKGRVRALIVPHAGYIYSGQVAGFGYAALEREYKTIFILASNHSSRAGPFAFSVADATHYETPLGRVNVSPIAAQLLEKELFAYEAQAHQTHVIEVQLPFLQRKYSSFEIVPIVTGKVTAKDLQQAAAMIASYLDDDTLLVVSSDLSHYHPYEKAVALDKSCIKAFASLDLAQAIRCEACGLQAALILLQIARENGWKAKILEYKNSGDTAGTKDKVVGYSTIAFYEEVLSKEEKQKLLQLSRRVLDSYVKTAKLPEIDQSAFPGLLQQKQGCFVTLEKDHQLRGCIGTLVPQEPLYRCVVNNTVNAALRDTRFQPVAAEELDDIEVEVSVLSLPRLTRNDDPARLLDYMGKYKPGVILKKGRHQSTYLPQVWEQLPQREEFLARLCGKGGLEQQCWRDPQTQVYTYQALAFKEHEVLVR